MIEPRLPRTAPTGPAMSLDERIAAVESRLVAHDGMLRQRFAEVRRSARAALRPRRWMWPALGGAALVLLLARGRARRRRAALAGMSPRGPGALREERGARRGRRAAAREFPWVRMISMAWPLLPAAWRTHVRPGTVLAVVSLALPVLERVTDWRASRAAARAR